MTDSPSAPAGAPPRLYIPGAFARDLAAQVDPAAEWRQRKAAALRRRRLDCNCRNAGQEVYFHAWCDRIACMIHRDDRHGCPGDPDLAVQDHG